jgi:hypothetical protein
VRNLLETGRFALVVDRWDENWSRLGYVLTRGRAALCVDPARQRAAIAALRARYPQYVAMDLDAARHAIVELAVERIHVWGRLTP